MRRLLGAGTGIVLVLALIVPTATYAATELASPSDTFAGATLLTGVTVPGFSGTGTADMSTATYPDVGGEQAPCGSSMPTRTVWYTFKATMSGSVTITTTGSVAPNPTVSVYLWRASDSAFTRSCGSTAASVTFNVLTANQYWVQGSDDGTDPATLQLNLSFSSVTFYDRFSNARVKAPWWTTDTVDLGAATVETGEPSPTCNPNHTRSVWYRVEAPASGALVVEASDYAFSDLRLVWYESNPTIGGFGGLTQVGCRPLSSVIDPVTSTARVVGKRTYYAQVSDNGSGGGLVTLSFAFYPTPPNDAFDAAAKASFTQPDTVELWGATTEAGEPNPCGVSNFATRRSVWYTFEAPRDGTVTASSTGDMTGGIFAGTLVTAFRKLGPGFAGLSSGTCGSGLSVTFPVTSGATYFVQALEFSGWGTLKMAFSFTPDTTPPVISGTPTDITVSTPDPIGAEVRYPTPSAIDDLSGSVSVTCAPLSESLFPFGTTHVTCTATDHADNVATTGFDITVTWRAPVVVPPIAPIATYDVADAAMSGSGCWHHVYTGTVIDRGRTFYAGATCPPGGGHVADYRGGGGTLSDGRSARTVDEAHLFVVGRLDDQGHAINPVITLHLDGTYRVGRILIYGGDIAGNGLPGSLTGVTVAIDGRSVALDAIPFGAPGANGMPTGDLLDLSATPLAGLATSTIVLQGFQAGTGDQFSVAEIAVVVRDTTPPALSLPSDITAEATGPSGAAVTWVASATDVVDGTVPVTCTPASGATFALGPTTVTCTATDAAGNTATGTFAVLVRDTTPPALSLSDGMDRYPVDAGISIKATATDIVSGSVAPTCKLKQEATGTVTTVPCSYAADAWSLGALGQYTFLASATDAAGKTAEASFTFRVAATYSSVSNLTKQWSSKATVAKDLVAILDSAFAAEQRRQFTAEANKLTDFRAGVKAQSGKAFDAGKAALLIAFSYGL